MMDEKLLNNLLFLYDSLIFTLDTKEKTIQNIYKSNLYFKDKLDIEDFPKVLKKSFNLKSGFENNLIKFLYNLNIKDTFFTLSINYKQEDDTNIVLTYKAYKYEENKVLIAISSDSSFQLSEMDELTKTVNKTQIFNLINKSINDNKSFSIMLFTIDDFDSINKKYGKVYGDIFLIETVAAIKKTIENRGKIARVGLAEFLIFIEIEDDYNVLHDACADIRKSTKELSIHNIKQIEITATVGSATFPKDGNDIDTLLRKAEKALDRGIKKGRNCFIIYNEERCGKISSNQEIRTYNKKSNEYKLINLDANIIAGIIEILNRDGSFKKNVEDAISLLGNYFLLDRVVFIHANDDLQTLNEMIYWYNPSLPNKTIPRISPIFRQSWIKANDANGMFKINQVESNKNHPLYNLLEESSTTAILSFELEVSEKKLGSITFDMCTGNRFWQKNEISTLMLASKVIAIKLNKEIENELHYKQLYYDNETETINYNRWIIDVKNNIDEENKPYSIMQIGIVGHHNLKANIGNNAYIKILKTIASKLKSFENIIHCHEMDDIFLIYIPSLDKEYINHIFNEVSQEVSSSNPIKRLDIQIYAGVYINDSNDDINVALDKTVLACKQHNNSSTITFFSIELYEIQRERTMLEMHMKEALKNEEFLLYLQPKINSLTNKIVGAEALTRWNFNHNKMIYPNVFIPLFEETGFIEELDYSIFENVCKFQRRVIDDNKTPVPISINVSRYVVDFKKYLDNLNSIRKKYDIPAELIEIEITEGMYINNDDIISEFIKMLHDNGYKVSMDDFGSGYSNLSSLSSLDFDLIKLDKNFCKNQTAKDTIILSSVIDMMKKLNMNILCEGVETESYAEYLKSIGCYIIQGYLYDKPLPEKTFEEKYIK